jgi:hypothetical protein
MAGERLDMKMVRQGLNALDQKAQEPLEPDTHNTADAPSRNPLHQQAVDQRSSVIRDADLFEAVDKRTAAVMALMVLFGVVDVAIFLRLEGLAPLTHISDDHGVLLTSTAWIRVRGSTGAQPRQAGLTWSLLPKFQHNMAHTLRGVVQGQLRRAATCEPWAWYPGSRFRGCANPTCLTSRRSLPRPSAARP